uniref:WAP domain-containing protein n=1 Tax=Phasianus colchicus TaxID=9054 RepID=A0A669P2P2_PHACC
MGCTGSPGSPRSPHWGAQGTGLGSTSHIPWPGCLRVTGDLERERCRGCASHGLGAQYSSGSLPRNELFMLSRLALSCTLSPLFPPAKSGLCPWKQARRDAVCPNLCTDDRNCPGDQKCCFSGCGLTCTTPYTGTSCPYPHSSPGVHPPAWVCTLRAHLCTPHACHRGRMGAGWRPEGSWGTAKSGACPVLLRGSLGPCLDRCDSDADCPGAKKCCTTGCGHVCKLPTEGKIFVPWGRNRCLILCLEDKDCPPSQKCCLQDCGRTCVPPLQGKTNPTPCLQRMAQDGALVLL